jgi:hypothetical protein
VVEQSARLDARRLYQDDFLCRRMDRIFQKVERLIGASKQRLDFFTQVGVGATDLVEKARASSRTKFYRLLENAVDLLPAL